MALQQKDFTGQYTSGTGVVYTYILRVTENSVSTLENSSNITVKAILKDNYGISFSDWSTGVSCTLNGSEKFNEYTKRKYKGPGENVFYTWTGNVAHNADGTLRLTVGGKLWQNDPRNWSPKEITIEETNSNVFVLTRIPKESTLGATDAYIGSSTTISVNRKGTGYSHVIGWQFGDISGYIGADWKTSEAPVKLTDTSISFQLPEDFYDQIPKTDSETCTLTITTWSGATQVGEPQTATFTAMANPATCAPEVEGTVEDVSVLTDFTGNSKRIVRYLSTAQCTFTKATAKNGAYIVKKQVNGRDVTGDYLDIAGAENIDFRFTVTDSRGFTTTFIPNNLELVPYVFPTIEAVCKRTAPTENTAQLTVKGKCYVGDFGAFNNDIYMHIFVGGKQYVTEYETGVDINNGEYEVSLTINDLPYNTSHEITVTVSDNAQSMDTTAVKILQLPRGVPVFDWGESDFRFNVPVCLTGAYITAGLCTGDKLFIQTDLEAWDGLNEKLRSVFLFGGTGSLMDGYSVITGIALTNNMGETAWVGTEGVTVSVVDSEPGRIEITIPNGAGNRFTAISADPIKFL